MSSSAEKRIFGVNVTIRNKQFLNDPEGETVLNELILKEDYKDVLSVRAAKSFSIRVLAYDNEDALDKIKTMCEEIRLYNPIVSICDVSIVKDQ
ncbi:MAG TPA: phosphoribosylformylglycinamidine synthase subunit PurS [Candidatus Nitrosocosmicus sp.]|jgi:phosphoribosylformylglycinamidine synthase|nr:phosphoribosylformylglycinamidine synthase subunit PurS [Candidatus Nitrosocosmicus sp.]